MKAKETNAQMTFKTIAPSILYLGTPVVLITTIDDAGTTNIAPISSAWATGRTFVLGVLANSKTHQNLMTQKQCVLNFPDSSLHRQVEQIAQLTGMNPIPEMKKQQYQYSDHKFADGHFTKLRSDEVLPARIAECPVQLEAEFKKALYIDDDPILPIATAAVVVRIIKIHANEAIVRGDNHIDPATWKPLIYNFRHYFSLGEELGKSFKAEK